MPMTRTAPSFLLLASLALFTLSGCAGNHGRHTQEGKDAAQVRMDQLKSGVQLQMAQQQFLAGDLDKARKSIETAITAMPTYAPAHVLRGRIMMEQGELEGANQSFVTAQTSDPTSAEAHYFGGICRERFRQWQPAYEKYLHASELDRANPQYVTAAAEMLVHLKQPERAQALLTERRADFPHNAAIVQSLGHLAMLNSDAALAVTHYQDARTLAPDDMAILESLARAQVEAGKFADAEYNVAKLIDATTQGSSRVSSSQRAPAVGTFATAPLSRRDLQLLRIRCLIGLQRYAEARVLLVEQANEPDGQRDVATWIQLGHVSAKLEDAVRLRQVAAKLLSISPKRYEGHSFRALALMIQKDFPAAEQAAIAGTNLAENDASPWLVLATIQLRAGDRQGAMSSAQAAAAADPSSPAAQRLLANLSATATVPAE